MKLSIHTIIKQKPGLVASDMDNEKVMLHIENGKYYNLGEIGGLIWDYAEGSGKSIGAIVQALMKEYEISKEQCEKEVMAYAQQLVNAGIIEIIE